MIELLLVLSVLAALIAGVFMIYNKVSQQMLLKKQLDFVEEYVMTTDELYQDNFNNIKAGEDISTTIMQKIAYDRNIDFLNKENEVRQAPFGEYVEIYTQGERGNKFSYIAEYPSAGVYTEGLCVQLARAYISKYGNVETFSGDMNSPIWNDDKDKFSKIDQMCADSFSGGSPSSGLGFEFD